MQELKDILFGAAIGNVVGQTSGQDVQSLEFDSRKARSGSVFFAIPGTRSDGHDFIPQVIESGCNMIVAEKVVEVPAHVTLVVVDDSAKTLAIAANNFFGEPSQELKLIGVTGTNGKTTVTTLLHKLFTKLGYKVGLLSTVVNKIGEEDYPSTHTTPNPVALNQMLREMVDQGVTH